MNKIKAIGLILFLIGGTFACRKDDVITFAEIPMVNFNLTEMSLSRDTIDVQFGFTTEQIKSIDIHLILMGYTAELDREIGVYLEGDPTFIAEGLEIPEKWIMPMGKVMGTVKFNIKRNRKLIGKNGQEVKIRLESNNYFQVGIKDSLVVRVYDEIPTEWIGDADWYMGSIADYFGPCTKAKYEFIFKTFEEWNFTSWSIWGMMPNKEKFKAATRILKERLAAEGPIEDPNDPTGFITFP